MGVCLGGCSRPPPPQKANPGSRAENGGLPCAMFQTPCYPQKQTPVLEPRMGACLWRFPYPFPRTTDEFRTSRSHPNPKHRSPNYRRIPSFAELEVRPGNVRGRARSHPNPKHRSPNYRRIPDFAALEVRPVAPRNLRGRARSHPNPKHRSPNYRRIPDFAALEVRPVATS